MFCCAARPNTATPRPATATVAAAAPASARSAGSSSTGTVSVKTVIHPVVVTGRKLGSAGFYAITATHFADNNTVVFIATKVGQPEKRLTLTVHVLELAKGLGVSISSINEAELCKAGVNVLTIANGRLALQNAGEFVTQCSTRMWSMLSFFIAN